MRKEENKPMRKNWSSVHVVAAVAAPLLLGSLSSQVNAQPAVSEVNDTVSTATIEGAPLTDGSSSALSADAPTTPTENVLDAPAENEPAIPAGDDALPSLSQAQNNPYLKANTAGLAAHGETAGGQEYGAFVPPTDTTAKELSSSEAGAEMRSILGEEVFDRRVNISTPPDTEVSEVIRLLADRANLNFVYSEGVIQGRVTLNLKDVPLGVALQSLLSSQDLAIVREGANVMRIAPRKDVRPGTVDTRTIYVKLNWVTAEELATTLKAALGGGGANSVVQAHKESNTLIITDSAPNVALLRDLVSQLDVPEKQVMIEARMVELFIDQERGVGGALTVTNVDSSKNSLIGLGNTPVDGLLNSFLTNSGGRLGFGTVASIFGSDVNVAAALDGLEQRRVVHTLANPRIITLNNTEATIDITRNIPYLEAQQGAAQGVTAASVKFEEAGIKLRVTPNITNNGYVRMILEPEQRIKSGDFIVASEITQTDDGKGSVIVGSGGNAVPIIDKRSAKTNVIVRDEETVVLGGLREVNGEDTKQEYPWLGKTPVLGWFFKNNVKKHRKTDLMLFVTPHIVKAPTLTAAENYKYSRIDAHWDLPDYFFDDSVDQRESRHRGEADQEARNFYPENLLLPPPDGVDGSASAGIGSSADGLK